MSTVDDYGTVTEAGGVAELLATGITYRQSDFWVRQGYLRPERRKGRAGTGFARRWPSGELAVAARMARLVTAGIAPEAAAKFARESWPEGEIAPGVVLTVSEVTG